MIPKSIPLKSEDLFRLAMRHRSATSNPVQESYERLEFFGDSLLGFVIAEYLYEHHEDWDQGLMSKAKASVVQETPLADLSLRLGLDKYIELSPGEESTGGRKRASILADVFEAVVGAIYLESGLEKARWFILEQLQGYLAHMSTGDVSPYDHKSKLQEVAQAIWKKTPQYRIIHESGQPHNRKFVVQVLFDNEVMGEGVGRSKKEAEQLAAQEALLMIERAQKARKRSPEEF
jgi:ribonuclease-3